MKPLTLTYHLASYLSMAAIICSPLLQLSASLPFPFFEDCFATESKEMHGILENGLSYTLAPSPSSNNDLWIKLSLPSIVDEEQNATARLTQHALFYGTLTENRQTISSTLNHFGMDVEADSYVQANENEQSLQFSLADATPEQVEQLLTLVNHLTFTPLLDETSIELARAHLLQHSKEASEAELLALQSATAVDVRAYHEQWYRPEQVQLTVAGLQDPQELINAMNHAFKAQIQSAPLSTPQIAGDTTLSQLSAALTNRIDMSSENDIRIIDGKIWMKEPNWINKKANGRSLGAVLTVLGIGGIILAAPITVPAFFAGGLSMITGIYFMASPYHKDPSYIESVRQDDLIYGCAYAYKNRRAGLTLTPYERRALFLAEMVDHPQTLPRRPIMLLADLYQLTDPVITEIFTEEEMDVLKRIKRDFIQQRNQYKMLKESLEKELLSLTQPYAYARDASLALAQEYYNQDYYVIAKKQLQDARDRSIAEINAAFASNHITAEEKKSLIESAQRYYQEAISAPQFKAGLAAADAMLSKAQLEIQATYLFNVEMCKQSIGYAARMTAFEYGESSQINFFDNELTGLLATFPVNLPGLPDFLDLRTL